ncbi:alpha/beta fold hydrolase [Thermoleophilia bacterium SCSIO 60948]|nr:alpha/beta fold hydrolase [Thermoleophilia bacterium SCSIO 60948]
MRAEIAEVIQIHSAAGRRFDAGGVRSFVLDRGEGPAVVCLHGVPASSFTYRKVIPVLADEGVHGYALDFPGMGLADRPTEFDYSPRGLTSWLGEAIDALGIERCHLVVHDISGPIAAEWAIANPDRVLSFTALNTMLAPAEFQPPWMMRPFARRGLGRTWLRGTPPFLFALLFGAIGVADRSAISRREVLAYRELLTLGDGGRAFLRIMRSFGYSLESQAAIERGLGAAGFGERVATRIIWGERDTAIGADQLEVAKRVLGVSDPIMLDAKHFPQEDQFRPLGQAIADLAAPLG